MVLLFGWQIFFAVTSSKIFLMSPQSSRKEYVMKHSPTHPLLILIKRTNMSSVTDWWMLFITIMLDLVISFIILFCAYSNRIKKQPILYKIGFAAIAFGLFAQSGLNIESLLTGHDNFSASVPFWFLQDAGTLMIIIRFFLAR